MKVEGAEVGELPWVWKPIAFTLLECEVPSLCLCTSLGQFKLLKKSSQHPLVNLKKNHRRISLTFYMAKIVNGKGTKHAGLSVWHFVFGVVFELIS